MKSLERQIREEEEKLSSYKRLVDDKDKADRRLENLKQNLNQLSKMHDRKQKELALHEQTQEWKTLETQLNIEPVTFPEQGIDRYESAKIQTQNLKRDIGLREERLAHLKSENEKSMYLSNLILMLLTIYNNKKMKLNKRIRIKIS